MHSDRLLRGALRCALALTFGLASLVAGASVASAQDTPLYNTVPFAYDSGYAANFGDKEAIVISFQVRVPSATWLRLYFSEVELSGDPDTDSGSILRITSLLDADAQTQTGNHVEQWQKSSCYLNGDEVLVEVVAQPHTGRNRVVLRMVDAGIAGGQDTICGPTDDRSLSQDKRACRLLPIGCTGWIIDDCKSCLLTAGHCSTSNLQVAQFNVPLSTTGGSLVNPPASEQYSVDVSSKKNNGGQGIGNDWGYFGCFTNPNTGQSPFQRQLARYHLANPPAFNASQSIRITGYGTDSGSSNQVQQTHSGPWATLNGTTVQYRADTTGGNSGSPVVHEPTGDAIGIHTHGGCTSSGGQNSGTASTHSGLVAALAAPAGVCAGAGSCIGVGNNFCMPGPLFSVIAATGSRSIAANDLVLHANNIGVGKPGLFMYSLAKQNLPFPGGTGRLCVGGGSPIVRLPPVNSGAGTTFVFAVNYATLPPSGPITAGSSRHFQAWFRTTPGSSETSNGLTIAFTP
jgi:V8-like Glu-specific endopeptidase